MKTTTNGRSPGGIPMNEAHLAARAADRSPAGLSAKTGLDPFALREDLRRSSVPIDQFGSWRMHGLSFALLVVLPIMCAAIYYGLIAAEKYSVEFRFSVRLAAKVGGDERQCCADDYRRQSWDAGDRGVSPTWPRTTCEAATLSGNSTGTVGCGWCFRGVRRICCLASIQRRARTISGFIGGI